MYTSPNPSRPSGRPFTAEEREAFSTLSPLSIQRKIVSATLSRMGSNKRTWATDLKEDLNRIGRDVLNLWDPECDPVELLSVGVTYVLVSDRTSTNREHIAQHLADTPLPFEYKDRVTALRAVGWQIRACDYGGSILQGHMVDLQVMSVDTAEAAEANIRSRRAESSGMVFHSEEVA